MYHSLRETELVCVNSRHVFVDEHNLSFASHCADDDGFTSAFGQSFIDSFFAVAELEVERFDAKEARTRDDFRMPNSR